MQGRPSGLPSWKRRQPRVIERHVDGFSLITVTTIACTITSAGCPHPSSVDLTVNGLVLHDHLFRPTRCNLPAPSSILQACTVVILNQNDPQARCRGRERYWLSSYLPVFTALVTGSWNDRGDALPPILVPRLRAALET